MHHDLDALMHHFSGQIFIQCLMHHSNVFVFFFLAIFSPQKSLLSHSNQRQDASRCQQEQWKLETAQFRTDIRSLDHTWLGKIKQDDFMKSSFSSLWIKCTLVHFSFHLKWNLLNEAQSNRRSDILLGSTIISQPFPLSFFSCITPQKLTDPCLWGGV